jgi:hypothetical protein
MNGQASRCGTCDSDERPLRVCAKCHSEITGDLQRQVDELKRERDTWKEAFDRQVNINRELRRQCINLTGRIAF